MCVWQIFAKLLQQPHIHASPSVLKLFIIVLQTRTQWGILCRRSVFVVRNIKQRSCSSCTRCSTELWIPDCPFLWCCSWIVEQFITMLETYLLLCNYCFRLTSMFLYASQREQSRPWLCQSIKCITRWLITKWVLLLLYYPQMCLGVPSTSSNPKNLARFL